MFNYKVFAKLPKSSYWYFVMQYLFQIWMLFIISTHVWSGGCANCKFEINAACNFCPNCGSSISLQPMSSSGMLFAEPDSNMLTVKHPKRSTENKHEIDSHYSLRKLLAQARAEGRFSNLWGEINSLYESSDYKDELFFLYARAVALRNIGDLKEALKVLNSCLRKINHDPSKKTQALQVYYELSFVNYLMCNHHNAVFYYYLFFIDREDSGIDNSTLNYAINSAFQVMADNSENAVAYNLLLYCWNKLKYKISSANVKKMHRLGFQ